MIKKQRERDVGWTFLVFSREALKDIHDIAGLCNGRSNNFTLSFKL